MPDYGNGNLASWTRLIAGADIPVESRTIDRLGELASAMEDASPRDIAIAVMQDPLMTAKLLAWYASHRGRRQITDIISVEGTVVMMGVPPFFNTFGALKSIEDHLAAMPRALCGLRKVIRRANNAADWAAGWAARRNDLDAGEVMIAALLHDITEMLMWCFAPDPMLEVERRQRIDPSLRSVVAQESVLGMPLNALHGNLVREWHLPELLISMMDDHAQSNARVRNVRLAVDLARHSANGWDDPALPDDYRAIGALLHMSPGAVRAMVDPFCADTLATAA